MRNNNEKFQIKSAAEILVCYSTNLLNSLLSLAKPYPGSQLWYTLTIFSLLVSTRDHPLLILSHGNTGVQVEGNVAKKGFADER